MGRYQLKDNLDLDMLETVVSVFWADADLALNKAVGATRKRGGRRAMAANGCKMPLVVTPVNGDRSMAGMSSRPTVGSSLLRRGAVCHRLLAAEISSAQRAPHLDEKPTLALSLSRSPRR